MNITTQGKRKFNAYVWIAAAAILFSIGIQLFVQVARTLPSGLSAISFIPAIVDSGLIKYTPAIYLLLNIPFLAFFWKKIKKDFLYKTIFFLVLQAGLGYLYYAFDDLTNELTKLIVDKNSVIPEVWPIFVISSIGAVFVGLATAISWKFGGSTGGSDVITYYLSTKKKISIGTVAFIVALVFVLISFTISVSVNADARSVALPILFATVIYVGISTAIINIVYPKYSKVHVEIHTDKFKEISKYLKKNYKHSWQIYTVESGYTGRERCVITTTMLLLEYRNFKNEILKQDEKVWISVTGVRRMVGNFDHSSVE